MGIFKAIKSKPTEIIQKSSIGKKPNIPPMINRIPARVRRPGFNLRKPR